MHVPLDEDDRRRGESDGDRFFHGLTENVFYGLMGIADPPLVEYISSLLVRFIRNDIFYELPGAPGVAVADLTDMLTDAQKRSGAASSQRVPSHRRLHFVLDGRLPGSSAKVSRTGSQGLSTRLSSVRKKSVSHCQQHSL